DEAAPTVGELVLTSGHGGVLPAGVPVGRVDLVRDGNVRVRPAVDLRHLSYVSILVGGTEGIDRDDLALEDYYTPLPEAEEARLFEGMNAAGERQ
ncbi:MAG: rod shape-determining protein MreC, partial [Candidatus Puniceispirillaceae bacterium]